MKLMGILISLFVACSIFSYGNALANVLESRAVPDWLTQLEKASGTRHGALEAFCVQTGIPAADCKKRFLDNRSFVPVSKLAGDPGLLAEGKELMLKRGSEKGWLNQEGKLLHRLALLGAKAKKWKPSEKSIAFRNKSHLGCPDFGEFRRLTVEVACMKYGVGELACWRNFEGNIEFYMAGCFDDGDSLAAEEDIRAWALSNGFGLNSQPDRR